MNASAASRSGAVLAFMLIAVALVMGVALFAGSVALSRSRLASDAVARAQLRAEAFSAAAMAAWAIDADTNGADHLLEPWAQGFRHGAAVATVADERARLLFPPGADRALGFLIAKASGVDEEDAMGHARRLAAWWQQTQAQRTNAVLHAEEELLLAPGMDSAALAATLPSLTVLGDGRININTVSHDVFVALALGAGAEIGTAETLFNRVLRSRRRGEWFASLTMAEAHKLLRGAGDALSAKEVAALQAILPRLGVESDLYRITATAERAGVRRTVQCIYERGTGRIHRWTEW
ncbi:MAG: hypothetical protein ACOX9C_00770 [Kiritimatiellia bacterium]|jgi:hypothetical protein